MLQKCIFIWIIQIKVLSLQRKTNYTMTEQEFAELVRYVSENMEHDQDRYAHRQMGNFRCGLDQTGTGLDETINDLAEEWCNDNGIDVDEYWEEYGPDEVFFHDAYEFDKH